MEDNSVKIKLLFVKNWNYLNARCGQRSPMQSVEDKIMMTLRNVNKIMMTLRNVNKWKARYAADLLTK